MCEQKHLANVNDDFANYANNNISLLNKSKALTDIIFF